MQLSPLDEPSTKADQPKRPRKAHQFLQLLRNEPVTLAAAATTAGYSPARLALLLRSPSFRRQLRTVLRDRRRRRRLDIQFAANLAVLRLAKGLDASAELTRDQRQVCIDLLKLTAEIEKPPRRRPATPTESAPTFPDDAPTPTAPSPDALLRALAHPDAADRAPELFEKLTRYRAEHDAAAPTSHQGAD